LTKCNKSKEPMIKVLTHKLLAFTFSYSILAPWRYINYSNLYSWTSPMSSLVIFCLSSHYRFILLHHYKSVHPRTSVGYVQTISSDIARASPQLVSPLVSRICHRSGPDIFLYEHKSIVACTFQLCLVVGYIIS
jgi:hypothetical protein